MATELCGLFPDDDFNRAIDELDKPDVDGWEFFVESHGVTIYRLFNEGSGLYEYKIYGELDDVTPDICAQVYMDLDYRKMWDSYAKVLEVRKCKEGNLVYWEVNYPFPLWNRDYLYGRELRELDKDGKKVWIVLAKSIQSPDVAEKSGVVRVKDYLQSAALCTNGSSGTKAFMRYYDNPEGNIPTWLINWAAKTGVPQFLTMMHAACRGYPKYLEANRRAT
ncbi:phosphatidylcholine transfer protein-like isoform X2 [Physella acuta]|uniref:phosphatidylcholine transfer protein-like isoform X2 n=1 Tax=Physella acuta TaxID=109671 RepID=UPI0027DBC4EF|nr:phosphatidylcholine transfer protein-like isoform X2 [Physella acuta]